MPKFTVRYSEHAIRKIVVEADSAEEAERKVIDDDVDFDKSSEVDATVTGVNSVTEVEKE